jgi:hypothetical protein
MKHHVSIDKLDYANLVEAAQSDMADFLVYGGGSLQAPTVGTLRVGFEAVPAGGEVSVLGVQSGSTLRAFSLGDARAAQPACLGALSSLLACSGGEDGGEVPDYNDGDGGGGGGGMCCLCCDMAAGMAGAVVGKEVLLLEERHTTPVQMFRDENAKFGKRLNIMRLAGCLGISLGVYLVFNPVAVLLSFIPYLSGLISNLFFLLALIVGFVVGATEISVAWAFHRPEYLLGIYMRVDVYVFHLHFIIIYLLFNVY